MGKWRELFESAAEPPPDGVAGQEYEFGPPATEDELAAAEQALGVPLPPEVRGLLAEFNGVWRRTRDHHGSESREITYLDTKTLSVDVPDYFVGCGNPLPPRYALRRVVFVAQSNGFSDLWGVCASGVPRHKAGAVVRLNHEGGGLRASQPTLAEFVRAGPRGRSGRAVLHPVGGGPASDLQGLRQRRDRLSFVGWGERPAPDLVAQAEGAITGLIDRLIALGASPTEHRVREEVEGCIRQFDDLQWGHSEPWIGAREQNDICDALHELIDLSGFEATEEWTEVRDW